MAKKETRFEVVLKEGSDFRDDGIRMILLDKETGVQYLCWKCGYGGGITPLLDSEGKAVVANGGFGMLPQYDDTQM